MMLPGFINPVTNTMTLERAVPFQDDMDRLFGKWSAVGEPVLLFGSAMSGIVFCKIIYDVSEALCPVIFPGYNKLTKGQKVDWNNRGMILITPMKSRNGTSLVTLGIAYFASISILFQKFSVRSFSTAHASVASAIAFYLLYISDLFLDSAPYGPVIYRSSILSQFGLAFSCGYFIADLAILVAFYPILGGFEFVAHHVVSIISLTLAVHCGHAHLYLYIVVLSECTTPFINLRWYLNMLGLKGSKAYAYNGAFLAVLWLVVRVINFLYCYYHLYIHFDQVKLLHTAGFTVLVLAPPSLGAMNFFWFSKIMIAMYRTLSQKRAP